MSSKFFEQSYVRYSIECFWKSRYMTSYALQISTALTTTSKNSNRFVRHDLFRLNPCWELLRRFRSSRCATNLFVSIASNILPTIEVKLIGLLLLGILRSPFLNIGVILAILKSLGTIPSCNDLLKIIVKGFTNSSFNIFKCTGWVEAIWSR